MIFFIFCTKWLCISDFSIACGKLHCVIKQTRHCLYFYFSIGVVFATYSFLQRFYGATLCFLTVDLKPASRAWFAVGSRLHPFPAPPAEVWLNRHLVRHRMPDSNSPKQHRRYRCDSSFELTSLSCPPCVRTKLRALKFPSFQEGGPPGAPSISEISHWTIIKFSCKLAAAHKKSKRNFHTSLLPSFTPTFLLCTETWNLVICETGNL